MLFAIAITVIITAILYKRAEREDFREEKNISDWYIRSEGPHYRVEEVEFI